MGEEASCGCTGSRSRRWASSSGGRGGRSRCWSCTRRRRRLSGSARVWCLRTPQGTPQLKATAKGTYHLFIYLFIGNEGASSKTLRSTIPPHECLHSSAALHAIAYCVLYFDFGGDGFCYVPKSTIVESSDTGILRQELSLFCPAVRTCR